MPKRILDAIGRLKPWKPRLSLPSYNEPTPETSRKLSREDEAELALKHTVFTPGTAMSLIILFLLTIALVPAIQLVAELRASGAPGSLPMLNVFKVLPSAARIAAVRSAADVWRLLPQAREIKAAEKALETESVVSQRLLPAVQSLLTGKLGAGNEQVYIGRRGWLFYRPDVDYVTAPGFLDPAQLKHRAHAAAVTPNPITAIVHFRDQLASRSISLIVMSAPAKSTVEPEKLSNRAPSNDPLQNASFQEFTSRLAAAGVQMFDPSPLLMKRKGAAGDSLYLRSDTHWRPETMEFVAEKLATSLNLPPPPQVVATRVSPVGITAVGDIARMLKLPETQRLYPPESATTHQVIVGNGLWRPSADADVLVLGDSFANIFSLEALGWGESAGFVEHLSVSLGGRPLDCILRNSDGAFATREILARDLARGHDRLAGKKLVIWEFAARELAFGNWKAIDLKLGTPIASRFFAPAPGQVFDVTGTIEAISAAPRPGAVPYKDHIIAAHLVDLEIVGGPHSDTIESLVYLMSMMDNKWTPAARLRAGDRVKLRLRAWSEVADQKEQINRSDLDDPELQLEEPAWAELAD
ncbi:MAG: hypothetical protein H0U43_01395 [Chthoniobacterales bacterium]|nr:hypothetical protein [Chthoniobacterales bacterium]